MNLFQQVKAAVPAIQAARDQIAAQFIPTVQHILDNYFDLTIEEQNQVWKLVLKEATVYRSQEDELSIHIYPNIPQR